MVKSGRINSLENLTKFQNETFILMSKLLRKWLHVKTERFGAVLSSTFFMKVKHKIRQSENDKLARKISFYVYKPETVATSKNLQDKLFIWISKT